MKKFSWSYSALRNFETCGLRHYHYDILKDIQEGESENLQEGYRVHAAFDSYLKSKTQLPLGLGHYEGMLASIVSAPGQTHSERKLAIASDYRPVAWFSSDAWYRGVLDCTKINGPLAQMFDWKTGKPSIDTTQLQLAAALVFHNAPQVMQVRTALVFVNYDKVESETYERKDLTDIWGEILPRVRKLQQARASNNYQPRPSGLCKRWCQVRDCEYFARGGY